MHLMKPDVYTNHKQYYLVSNISARIFFFNTQSICSIGLGTPLLIIRDVLLISLRRGAYMQLLQSQIRDAVPWKQQMDMTSLRLETPSTSLRALTAT